MILSLREKLHAGGEGIRCRKVTGEVDSLSDSLGGKNGRVSVVSREKECKLH